EEFELFQIRGHGVQEDLLDACVHALLDAPLDIVDRASQVHGLDVVPWALVRNHAQHVALLLFDGCLARRLLAEPAEILVSDSELFLSPRRSAVTWFGIYLVEVLGDTRGVRRGGRVAIG